MGNTAGGSSKPNGLGSSGALRRSAAQHADADASPVQNMRITFWGVQGSCPTFPRPHAVLDYTRRVAIHTLSRAWEDIATRLKTGDGKAKTIEELIGGPLDDRTVEAYQAKIGLPDLPVYGGETTCVQVETGEGDVLFIDGGSGIRPAAREIVSRWPEGKPRVLHFFGTHEHLDHRSGLPFSQFCFARPEPFRIHVYGSHGFMAALDERFGIFSREIGRFTHMDDPLDFRMMSATFSGTELRNPDARDWLTDGHETTKLCWAVRDVNDPVRINRTTVTAFDVYHGATRSIAYKIEHAGARFVFCTDHELRYGPKPDDPKQAASLAAERRLREHCTNADAAYMDGQYFRREYDGQVGIGTSPSMSRLDWGHGCIEDCLDRIVQCKIRRAYIGHHDPERDWAEQMRMDHQLATLCQGEEFHVELAKADSVIDL